MKHTFLLACLAMTLQGCGGGSSPTAATPAPTPTPAPGPSAVVLLTTADFNQQVAVEGVVAMVEFFSPTCSHCRAMEPLVEALALEFEGRALVGKIDVTQEQALTQVAGVWGYPTFIFFRDGVEVRRLVGGQSYEVLVGTLNWALGGA